MSLDERLTRELRARASTIKEADIAATLSMLVNRGRHGHARRGVFTMIMLAAIIAAGAVGMSLMVAGRDTLVRPVDPQGPQASPEPRPDPHLIGSDFYSIADGSFGPNKWHVYAFADDPRSPLFDPRAPHPPSGFTVLGATPTKSQSMSNEIPTSAFGNQPDVKTGLSTEIWTVGSPWWRSGVSSSFGVVIVGMAPSNVFTVKMDGLVLGGSRVETLRVPGLTRRMFAIGSPGSSPAEANRIHFTMFDEHGQRVLTPAEQDRPQCSIEQFKLTGFVVDAPGPGRDADTVGLSISVGEGNFSGTPCRTDVKASVRILDLQGGLLSIEGNPRSANVHGLLPEQNLDVSLDWSNWCGSRDPVTFILELPTGRRLETKIQNNLVLPKCRDSSKPSVIEEY